MNPSGHYVVRSPTINIFVGERVLETDPARAKATVAAMRIYPYSQRDNPPNNPHLTPDGRKWSGTQPRGLAYWEGLSAVINEEPVLERDRMMLGMLQPLGIEKGKPFRPTERQKNILVEATRVGEVMARTIGFEKRFEGTTVWPGKHWEISLFLQETSQEAANYTQFDERTSWFYEAVGVSTGMMGRTVGFGQAYLESSKDEQGQWLDGAKTYRLHIPPTLLWRSSGRSPSTTTRPAASWTPACSPIVRRAMTLSRMPMARWTFTSAPQHHPESRRRTGSRRSPVKAGSLTSVSTARPNPTLTVAGCYRTSRWLGSEAELPESGRLRKSASGDCRGSVSPSQGPPHFEADAGGNRAQDSTGPNTSIPVPNPYSNTSSPVGS
jgi:hypothetical protein